MLLSSHSHSALSQSRNKFVETALSYALTYAVAMNHTRIGSTSITILADRNYYSPPGSSGSDISPDTHGFLDFGSTLDEAHKTGLGSSAALVTALIATVIAHYTPHKVVDMKSSKEKYTVHNLAQAAHCAAQGKIGSGFDIAAATYGSCIYQRFSPSLLEGLGDIGSRDFSHRLESLVEGTEHANAWDTSINKDSGAIIPPGLRLLMCDVDCGSETVGMVRKVLSWRKEMPEEASSLFDALQELNEDLATELNRLALQCNTSAQAYEKLSDTIRAIRSLTREMSERSGVPIEPKAQTKLIDALSKLPGVVGGVVPGAGGFDAIALLVEDKDSTTERISKFLQSYRLDEDTGEVMSIRNVRLLGVKQVNWGVKKDEESIFQEWLR